MVMSKIAELWGFSETKFKWQKVISSFYGYWSGKPCVLQMSGRVA